MTSKGAKAGIGLRLRHVVLKYPDESPDGSPGADGLDLFLEPGSVAALVGPSGAGKTTLLRLCGASLRPSSGILEWIGGLGEGGFGEGVLGNDSGTIESWGSDLRALRSQIGFVFQDLRLVPQLRVIQNVISGRLGRMSVAATVRNLIRPSRRLTEEVFKILERLGIEDKLYQRTDRLSGGQQQRVAVARALFQQGRLLLADEPVASLDPVGSEKVLGLMKSEAQGRGATLLVGLHDVELAQRMFPRLIGVDRGRVLFDRPSVEVKARELKALFRPHGASADEVRRP